MYNGIINVYKEKGYTSHDVVAIIRRLLKQKKVGHTGTLDPEATGVLPICVGKGTKAAGLLTDKDKRYRAVFELGEETDTQDHTGEVINRLSYSGIDEQLVLDTIQKFIGPIEQIPPMYSAIKVDGKKLYDLARKGIEVERKSRSITILDIYDIVVDIPKITMTIHCSKGTYIRTLCRDIAEELGTCGHMTSLERIASGNYLIENAYKLEEIESLVNKNALASVISPIDQLFPYKKMTIPDSLNKFLYNGNKIPVEFTDYSDWELNERFNVYDAFDNYMGVYEWSTTKERLIPIKFFDLR